MIGQFLLPGADGLQLLDLIPDRHALTIVARSTRSGSRCPVCRQLSIRVHSQYWRTAADFPWREYAIRLRLVVRRFFCSTGPCPRAIFTERLPDILAPSSRRTARLNDPSWSREWARFLVRCAPCQSATRSARFCGGNSKGSAGSGRGADATMEQRSSRRADSAAKANQAANVRQSEAGFAQAEAAQPNLMPYCCCLRPCRPQAITKSAGEPDLARNTHRLATGKFD